MSDEFDRDRLDAALAAVEDWPVDNVSAAVVGPEGLLAVRGDDARVYRLASVTKPIVAVAALLAVEEEAISLDDAAGPEGSTVRHLLAHASGLDFSDRGKVRAAPGERRIYSSAGFEVLADHIADATGIAFPEYLTEAVCQPLGMGSTVLEGSAGHGASASLADMVAFAGELVAPRLLAPETLEEAVNEQFRGLDGVVPGYGMHKPCPWGLGFELREAKHPHWTGQHNSPATFGHFGQSGTLLWVQPEIETALVVLTDRDFGDWAKPLWPELSDRVVDAATRRNRPEDSLGG
ncbi:beta-lactamase family protein [Dietzia sp. SLG310A2-38A2]|uniref:serine hydrolase domain-containing protein n=1 Tax=Dietzia sp. SLG310A2-38A2 TaxID=1630643 RepID=UPI0015FB7F69|nr:serine hydrolase domain-containing protein [Dietzia sp. SLG310A2-38A2]MBB1030176.1 beta-lactamase family protein [Dietzia sp. SLG310A2-38A2]